MANRAEEEILQSLGNSCGHTRTDLHIWLHHWRGCYPAIEKAGSIVQQSICSPSLMSPIARLATAEKPLFAHVLCQTDPPEADDGQGQYCSSASRDSLQHGRWVQ